MNARKRKKIYLCYKKNQLSKVKLRKIALELFLEKFMIRFFGKSTNLENWSTRRKVFKVFTEKEKKKRTRPT